MKFYVYAISFIIFLLLVYLFSGTLQWYLWIRFGKNLDIKPYGDCNVYLADNFPFFIVGRYYKNRIFVKRAFYKDGTEFVKASPEELAKGYRGTKDTIRHELKHHEQMINYCRKYGECLGTAFYFIWATANQIGFFLRIYRTQDDMPIEREPEKEELK